MKITTAYAAKRALFDLLAVQAQAGFPLEGVQVTYQAPAEASPADLYGGGIRFEQNDLSGEPDAMVVDEVMHLTVIVRVSNPDLTVRQADAEVERIGDVFMGLFDADPWLDDAKSVLARGVSAGVGDYEPSAGWGRAVLVFELDVQCLMS
jgi:hypothetical protein